MSLTAISSVFSNYLFLSFIVLIPLIGSLKKIPVYDAFCEGAREGIDVVIKIIPYMVAMVVGIGMLRASGAIDSVCALLGPALVKVGFPVELLPLALVRPFSGAATNAVFIDILKEQGGQAYLSHVAGTMLGSTETTFYVIALYFGSVNIQRIRHAAWAGLIADFSGIVASVIVCKFILLPMFQ